MMTLYEKVLLHLPFYYYYLFILFKQHTFCTNASIKHYAYNTKKYREKELYKEEKNSVTREIIT